MLNISMLSTGEEVLHGDIEDTNAAWLARTFYQQGFALTQRATVSDDINAIARAIEGLCQQSDIIIINGGLGPTADDVTAQAAAQISDKPLTRSDYWVKKIEAFYQKRQKPVNEANLKQAMIPKGSQILENPNGTACGFMMHIRNTLCFFTPGVPQEFYWMVDNEILPILQTTYPDVPVQSCSRLYTLGLSESNMAAVLDKLQLPSQFHIGYRCGLPFTEVKLFGPQAEQDMRFHILKMIYGHIAEHMVSVDEPMQDSLAQLLAEKNVTLAIAEQFTAGDLTHWLHENERLSQQLKPSWILNSLAQPLLAGQDALAAALAMAAASRERNQAVIGLASGQLQQNQVAVGLSTAYGEWGQIFSFHRQDEPATQKRIISAIMLDMVRRNLESKPMFARYSMIKREREMFMPPAMLR